MIHNTYTDYFLGTGYQKSQHKLYIKLNFKKYHQIKMTPGHFVTKVMKNQFYA